MAINAGSTHPFVLVSVSKISFPELYLITSPLRFTLYLRPIPVNKGDVIKYNSGKELFDTETRTNGCVDPAFISKNNMRQMKKPEYFVGLFLLFSKNQQGTKEMVSFE